MSIEASRDEVEEGKLLERQAADALRYELRMDGLEDREEDDVVGKTFGEPAAAVSRSVPVSPRIRSNSVRASAGSQPLGAPKSYCVVPPKARSSHVARSGSSCQAFPTAMS